MNLRDHYNPFRGFKKIKQINNLRIFQDESVCMTQFKIGTPKNKILEEFGTLKDAEDFCKTTKDFTLRK